MERGERGGTRRVSRVAAAAFALATLALLGVALAALGSRWGWWHFRTGFTLVRWFAYGGAAAFVLALVGVVRTRPGGRRRGLGMAVLGLLLGAAAFGVPWGFSRRAASVPPIHDITTDLENPPEFIAIRPLRADAANPPEYAGPETAAQQREAYPDIQPLMLDVEPRRAFALARSAAEQQGWEIVAADSSAGRIEATATTRWFGFKDDVVVRVTPAGGGSRIDVRSKSRVGRSDVGANAARIRSYLEDVRELAERAAR